MDVTRRRDGGDAGRASARRWSSTALTDDQALIDRLLGSDLIGRLNLGPIQTNTIAWDQPHEGNLFEHLYGDERFSRSDDAIRTVRFCD